MFGLTKTQLFMYKSKAPVALLLNVNTDRPLQTQLFDQLRSMILDGQLKAGAALPPSRTLSEQLGVSRKTVVNAYDRLLQEGFIESKPSIGTFVSEGIQSAGLASGGQTTGPEPEGDNLHNRTLTAQLVAERHQARVKAIEKARFPALIPADEGGEAPVARPSIDFQIKGFDSGLFPERAWRRSYSRQCGQVEGLLQNHDPAGYHRLRRAIADHLGPARGIVTQPENIITVANLDEGRALLCALLAGAPDETPGIALVEAPGPSHILHLLNEQGMEMKQLGIDEQGILTSELPRDVDKQRPGQKGFAGRGMVYTSPTQSSPFGTSLSLKRRIELFEWARRCELMIVEDEAESDFGFHSGPLTALKGLDQQDLVIYLGGFERLLGPGIGIGYLVLPPALVPAASALKTVRGCGPNRLLEAAMADFMESGAYDRHLRRLRKKTLEKRELLVNELEAAFGPLRLFGEDGGLQIAWFLPTEFGSAERLAKKARSSLGIKIYTAGDFGPAGCPMPAIAGDEALIVMGYGALEPHEITKGVSELVKLACKLPTVKRAAGGDAKHASERDTKQIDERADLKLRAHEPIAHDKAGLAKGRIKTAPERTSKVRENAREPAIFKPAKQKRRTGTRIMGGL